MSYASVAANNAPPLEEQPHPDPALLNATPPHHSAILNDTSKVTLVPPEFKEQLQSSTPPSVADFQFDSSSETRHFNNNYSGDKASRQEPSQERPGHSAFFELTKHYLFHPAVAGGLIGLVNIGLLASVGRIFYLRPQLRRDTVAISSAIAATVALVSAESFAYEKYRRTPHGQAEERRVKKEGALIYRRLREQILRPGVLGGFVGLVNAAVLGAVGYISFQNWNRTWDKRTVSAVSLGLLTLWGGEGFIAEKYQRNS
ncbi:hypothetical protein HYPSUDRAFT_33597 [Hypholoma sublateritium FD-334 SS-4]|uniref:Uncharacterized protein n=1 Tax=Hypholoma sublateritium (strain FD-334 SS-4) TaxID=945553 RepID=A0A0D2QBR8_HYPSF|nr:hypothetical protein HYPSUDRAFT_33597 [Hypholoma sublateritium FD-334 SS-4]